MEGEGLYRLGTLLLSAAAVLVLPTAAVLGIQGRKLKKQLTREYGPRSRG